MDENKREKLKELGYVIEACGICEFAELNGEWGVCKQYTYDHGKHSVATRQLSIHRSGRCVNFQPKSGVAGELGGFAEFLPQRALD